jgi:SAM-dependent methyltransferase
LFEKGGDQQPGDVLSDTAALYSHIWSTGSPDAPPHPAHLEAMEEALGKSVVQGKMGLEAGSGSGNDTTAIAMRHPSVEIISLDISEGVYHTYHRTTGLSNVHVVRASVLAIPLKSDIFDFAYSYGVLHHTTDPEGGLREVVRVLRRGGVVSLYLYEDHADNPWKAIPLRLINAIRVVTTKLNARLLSGLCYLLSPFVVVVFSIPARIMFRYQATRRLAAQMPFNFGNSLFSLHTDLLDRFGAPVELRYGREKLVALLEACRLSNLITTKLRTIAGWAARGVKKLV